MVRFGLRARRAAENIQRWRRNRGIRSDFGTGCPYPWVQWFVFTSRHNLDDRGPTLISRPRFLAIALVLAAVGCSGDDPLVEDPEERGALLSDDRIETVSVDRIESFGVPVAPQSPVELLRITYRTIDANGLATIASALLARPTDIDGPLAIASYQHGTVVRKTDVASVRGLGTPEALVAVIFATTGYLAVMPDYLGLGDSDGLHPFVHAESLASAVVDALRATRNFARRHDISLESDVYLIGYSEGGYATAAAQRRIESSLSDEFSLGASSPMAAPFDLSGAMVDLLAQDDPYSAPFFLPYTLLAYNDVYGLAESPSEFLSPPFDQTIPPLFDGTRSGGEIDAELPDVPKQILREEFVDSILMDDSFSWRRRLEENTLLSWTPASPTRLYHCEKDELIPIDNSITALSSFLANGAPESRVDLVTGDFGKHAECAAVFILLGKFWIDEVRGMPQSKRPEAALIEQVRRSDWRPVAESP